MVENELQNILLGIIRSHEWLVKYWDDGLLGWAPRNTTLLLEKNRLDRLLELAWVLPSWMNPDFQSEGHLILAWANLGALVEGVMKWFLCIYEGDYCKYPKCRKGKPIDPDRLSFNDLREYYKTYPVWISKDAEERDQIVLRIQHRRNAIHAYQDREIGTFDEFWEHVREYDVLLDDLISRTPELPHEDYYLN